MKFKTFVPKEFLCRFPLKHGALFAGIFMIFVALIASTVLVVQVVRTDVNTCQKFVWQAAFSFDIIAIIYNLAIVVMNLGLIWAVLQSKANIIMCWVIVTDVWLAQTFLLLLVLLCIYSLEVSLAAWIMCIIFGFLAMGILLYLSMVVFGYWLELREETGIKPPVSISTARN